MQLQEMQRNQSSHPASPTTRQQILKKNTNFLDTFWQESEKAIKLRCHSAYGRVFGANTKKQKLTHDLDIEVSMHHQTRMANFVLEQIKNQRKTNQKKSIIISKMRQLKRTFNLDPIVSTPTQKSIITRSRHEKKLSEHLSTQSGSPKYSPSIRFANSPIFSQFKNKSVHNRIDKIDKLPNLKNHRTAYSYGTIQLTTLKQIKQRKK